jgi:hypothetical protein
MIQQACDRVITLSAGLGSVPGLLSFASEVKEIASKLLVQSQLGRDELIELKQCLTMATETICHLRCATTARLRTLGVEQDDAG